MHKWLATVNASEPAQFLLDHVADAVIAVDADLVIRYWNQAATTIYGWEHDEALGRRSTEVVGVLRYCDGSEEAAVIAKIGAEGVWRGEVVQRHRTGRTLNIEAAIHLLKDAAGATIGMIAVNRDIGGRQALEEESRAALAQAEQARRDAQAHARRAEESLALTESLIAAAPVGFAFFDRGLRFQVVNERFAACNGKSVAAHLGRTPREVVPQIADALEDLVRQVATSGEPIVELPLAGEGFGPPWEGKHWLETFYPVTTPAGHLLGVGVVSVEVSELKRLELDLSRSRMQLAGIIDSAMDAIITVDERQAIVLFNKAAERLFGVPAAEVLGTPLDRFIAPEHRDAHRAHIESFGRTGQPASYGDDPGHPVNALRADGTVFPIETSLSQLSADGGTFYTVILRDVSARHEAERLLRASEANLRAVFENSAQSFVLLDREHRLVLWNRLANERSQAVTGKAFVAGASIEEYTLPGLIEPLRASLAQAVRGEPVHIERNLGAPERPIWLAFDYIPVRDDAGAVIGTCLSTLDVTAERVALEAITRSEERFRALVAGASDLIVLLDDQLRLRYASPAWERMLGSGPGAWVDRNTFELIHPDDLPAAQQALQQLLRGDQEPPHVTVRLRHAHGGWVWAEVVGSDLRAHPAVQGIVLTARDVTERKRLTEQLLQAQKMESVGRLAGGVAHDFNNLLTAITGYLQLALDELPVDSLTRDDIVEAQKAARRAEGLTRQLLAFARKQEIAPRPCALNDLIAEMDRLLRRLIGEDITLVTELDPQLAPVMADPGQIEQVIVNLAVNARDAMPDGGTLTITTEHVTLDAAAVYRPPHLRPGAYVRLTVRDTGVGMSEQVRERAFEPFFTTKGPGHGTGLGLATCYGIVAKHGGAIEIASQPGEGAAFLIYLPQTRAPAPPPPPPASRRQPSGSEMILVVEDDTAVRSLTARVLRDHGYTVVEACDGVEALQVLGAQPAVRLVLSDMVMPRLSGRELVARLRAERPQLPVVCMSGYSSGAGEEQHDPRVPLIHKPFTPPTLLQVVRSTLDRAAAGRA